MLCGTKLDLREDPEMLRKLQLEGKTPITHSEAESLRAELGIQSYRECSAKTQKGMREVFNEAIRLVVKPDAQKQPKKKKNWKLLMKKCTIM